MGITFQAAQLTHERFLTIEHSCKIPNIQYYTPEVRGRSVWQMTKNYFAGVIYGQKSLMCQICSLKGLPLKFTDRGVPQVVDRRISLIHKYLYYAISFYSQFWKLGKWLPHLGDGMSLMCLFVVDQWKPSFHFWFHFALWPISGLSMSLSSNFDCQIYPSD